MQSHGEPYSNTEDKHVERYSILMRNVGKNISSGPLNSPDPQEYNASFRPFLKMCPSWGYPKGVSKWIHIQADRVRGFVSNTKAMQLSWDPRESTDCPNDTIIIHKTIN